MNVTDQPRISDEWACEGQADILDELELITRERAA